MVNFDLSCTAHVANFDLCIRALKTHFSPTDGVVKLVGVTIIMVPHELQLSYLRDAQTQLSYLGDAQI